SDAITHRSLHDALPILVGQEHIVKALVNSIEQNRLHHAYLFTGTRGIGKTTIARILAKALNCELGPTTTPCGKCTACQSIDRGRSEEHTSELQSRENLV